MLTGRRDDVIVTAGGKNVHPARWEARIQAHSGCAGLVAHALVVGAGKPYLAAVLVLDAEQLPRWGRSRGLDVAAFSRPDGDEVAVVDEPQVNDLLAAAVASVNADFARSEQVRRFAAVLICARDEHELLTPTQKLKRRTAQWLLGSVVEGLYRDDTA